TCSPTAAALLRAAQTTHSDSATPALHPQRSLPAAPAPLPLPQPPPPPATAETPRASGSAHSLFAAAATPASLPATDSPSRAPPLSGPRAAAPPTSPTLKSRTRRNETASTRPAR